MMAITTQMPESLEVGGEQVEPVVESSQVEEVATEQELEEAIAETDSTSDEESEQEPQDFENYERIEIPFPKSTKATAAVNVWQDKESEWRSGYQYKTPKDGGVSDFADKFPTRMEAILAAVDAIDVAIGVGQDARVSDVLDAFRQGLAKGEEEQEQLGNEGEPDTLADTPAATSTTPADPAAHYKKKVEAATERLKIAALEQLHADNAAKFARAEFKLAVAELEKIVARGEEHLPLFDGKEEAAVQPVADSTMTECDQVEDGSVESVSTVPADNTWRDTPLADLSLTKGIIKSLAESGLSTVGQLADYTAADKRLIDIGGIGQGKADQIDEALTNFWAQRSPVS